MCLFVEAILKTNPSLHFFYAYFGAITAIKKLGKWEKVWEDIPTLYLGFVWAGKMEFGEKSPDAPLVEELVSDDKLEKKTIFSTVAKIEFVRPKQQEKPVKYAEMYRSQSPRADCNYHQRERVVSENNYTRVNYNYSAKKVHLSAHRNMASREVLMKTGLRPLNNARTVNTAHPKTIVYSARPMSPFSKSAQSTVKRPYQIRTTLTNKNFNQKVNTAKGKFYTARPKAVNTARPNSVVVNAVRKNQVNVVKASTCWVWRPTKLNSASITLKRHNYVDARGKSNGYSRHMTGNMSYLSDFKDFDGGYVTFGGGAKEGKLLVKELLKLVQKKVLVQNASNDEPQPPSDVGKKDDEGVCKESEIDDQERPKNSTQDVNTVGPSINTEPDMFSLGNNATLEATHADVFGDETKVDMSNITTTYLVSSTPNARIYKVRFLMIIVGSRLYSAHLLLVIELERTATFQYQHLNEKADRNCLISVRQMKQTLLRDSSGLRRGWCIAITGFQRDLSSISEIIFVFTARLCIDPVSA
ncbi:hypothetical protein Tco_0845698 [Tanacetum coccineum]